MNIELTVNKELVDEDIYWAIRRIIYKAESEGCVTEFKDYEDTLKINIIVPLVEQLIFDDEDRY